MAVKDNVVFKCFYYKPKEKYNAITQADKIKKRDFLSCNSLYNYVSYVDTGASNKLPKDFTEYVGNNEKSCGAFNQNGLLNDKQKKELKGMLRTTQSCIWDCVISFREDFGEKYCRDYEQAFNFVKSELPKFFTRAGLNKDNIIWYAGLHENTDNKHIHISFFEKKPEYYKNGGKLSYHNGTISKQVLIDSKRIFEQKLTNATAEIVKARKDLIERYNIDLSPFKLTKKAKQIMLNLYDQMPKSGRISYDSENMLELKKQVDNITEFLLNDENFRRGVNTPHIVLNYLDYLLWTERDNTEYKKLDFAQFSFEFRNSVEHWYPQHPSEQSFEKWHDVDRFGNLCIIQRNINSKFSNLSPASKKNTYGQMIEKGSLKLRVMSELTKDDAKWKNEICALHEKEMLNLLRSACNIPIY